MTPTNFSSETLSAVRAALRGEHVSFEVIPPRDVTALILHGVAPLLYRMTRAQPFRSAAIREAALEPLRETDTREVLAALARAGVETFILKGTALAYSLYASPDLRPRSDTDLLIRHESLETARRALLDIGFSEAVTSGDEHGLRQTAFSRRDAGGVEHSYDVHWAITNTPLFSSVLGIEEIRAHAVGVDALGPGARALGRVHALLHACIHRVAHHHDDDRLIWLVDIELLRAQMSEAEHEEFWRLAAERQVVAVCSRSIALAEELYSHEASNEAGDWLSAERLAQREATAAFIDRDITHGRMLLANLGALPARDRVRRLWQVAFPPAAFVKSRSGISNPLLLPLLYAARGVRGILRLFRRVEP